jgi:hypothetical protein
MPGGAVHWIEINKTVWTRRDVKNWHEHTGNDAQMLETLRKWATDCHITDSDGQVYERIEQLTPEVLDTLEAAVLRLIYDAPLIAYGDAMRLGELSGGKPSNTPPA